MCVDCVLASSRIAQVDLGDGLPPEVVLSHRSRRRACHPHLLVCQIRLGRRQSCSGRGLQIKVCCSNIVVCSCLQIKVCCSNIVVCSSFMAASSTMRRFMLSALGLTLELDIAIDAPTESNTKLIQHG
jgi:hypothetical protein